MSSPPEKEEEEKVAIQLHPEFTTGNITLVAKHRGFRIQDFYLKARSEVFRTMFGDEPAAAQEIDIPDASPLVLEIFVRALMGLPITSSHLWPEYEAAIRLCLVYECPSAGRMILTAALRRATARDLSQAFEMASHFNDYQSAVAILCRGYETYDLPHPQLSFIHEVVPALQALESHMEEDKQEIRDSWLEALALAKSLAKSDKPEEPTPNYDP